MHCQYIENFKHDFVPYMDDRENFNYLNALLSHTTQIQYTRMCRENGILYSKIDIFSQSELRDLWHVIESLLKETRDIARAYGFAINKSDKAFVRCK